MELNIGTNIKKLRLEKGYTQERLADLLNISSTAVSKWEAKNTYPDITMLFPLANIFGVSIDELMGYDEEKVKADIENLLGEYRRMYNDGDFNKAREIIAAARNTYPNDYRIMNTYMWEIAGGYADNDSDVLMKNCEEFTQICECILNGCDDERLRLDALTMKAKLLHAEGDTDAALGILDSLPSWVNSSAQRTEQLFAKDTPEFRYWIKKNMYGFLDMTANKIAKSVWYDDTLSNDEKIKRIEVIGGKFTDMRKTEGLEFFAICERMIFAELANRIGMSESGSINDVMRVCEKQFAAAQVMNNLASSDEVLKKCIFETYKTENVLQYLVDWRLNTKHPRLAKLRENKDYTDMLKKWRRVAADNTHLGLSKP